MRRSMLFAVGALVLALSASTAVGSTTDELLQRALVLDGSYQSLLERVAACPDGGCSDREAIQADAAELQAERLQLKADRDALNPCSGCGALDAAISSVESMAAAVASELEGWDGQG